MVVVSKKSQTEAVQPNTTLGDHLSEILSKRIKFYKASNGHIEAIKILSNELKVVYS